MFELYSESMEGEREMKKRKAKMNERKVNESLELVSVIHIYAVVRKKIVVSFS